MASPDHRILAWALIVSQFAPPFMFSGVAVLLPEMGKELAAGATQLGLVETLFLAGSLAFLLPVGRLADAADRRTMYKASLVFFALSSLLIGALSSMTTILVIRFFQGVSSAVVATTGGALLADIVPPDKRGAAFGRSIGFVYAGLTLGPVVAGFLIDLWGWRAVFYFGAAVLIAGFVIVQALMPSGWKRAEPSIHLPSTALMILAVLALVGGTAWLRAGALGYVLIAAGLSLGVFFLFLQTRVEKPLLDVGALLNNRSLADALLIQMLLYMNAFTSIFMMSIYLQVVLEQPAKTSGQVLAIGSVIMAVMAPIAGSLSDRFSPNRVSIIGVASVFACALAATMLSASSSLIHVIAVLSLQGLGFALFSSPNMALIMGSVPPQLIGTASALGAKSRSMGMLGGMLVTGLLISVFIGNDPVEQHGEKFIGVMNIAYSILAGTTGTALILSWWRRGQSGTNQKSAQ